MRGYIFRVSPNAVYKIGGEVENIVRNHNCIGKHGQKAIGDSVRELHVLPELLQGVLAIAHQKVWFIHDGTPVHFTITVRNHQKTTQSGRWIGCVGPVTWPPHFVDPSTLNLFFYNHLKSFMCEMPVAIVEDPTLRFTVASADVASIQHVFERFKQCFILRCRLCYDLRGNNFKQFL
ncbi:uncharacterized protein TNCV_4119491 [Trichonephila clavipes]|nr:uncharacterized protein TNCV_4119491 [Trichonephila clavipes]